MPTYAYKCQNCQHELDVHQKMVDQPLKLCPKCGKEALKRGPGGGIGLHFSGGGWYKDHYGLAPKAEETASKGSCCPCSKSEGSCEKKS